MKTTDQIYEEMKEKYAERTGLRIDDGGDMALRLYTAAAQLYSLWVQSDYVERQAYPQTANGLYLDYHAELRGLERSEGTYAKGELVFKAASKHSVELQVPAGTCCMTAGGVEFITTETGSIAPNGSSCRVPAVAREAGSEGNVPANSIVFMTLAPIGIDACYNPDKFTGGVGNESDASLRERILASYRKLPNGANAAYYEAQALDVDGVTAVSVIPKSRGLGTVDVVIASEGGMPTEEMLETVQKKLEAQREICVSIEVLSPVREELSVSAKIACKEGYDYGEVSEAVKVAIEDYFTGNLLGKNVLLAKLGDIIFDVEGVENYSIVTPAGDAVMTAQQLPVLESVTITELEG